MGCPEKVQSQKENAGLPIGFPRGNRLHHQGKGRPQLGVDTRKMSEGRLPDFPRAMQHLPPMRHESGPRGLKHFGPEHTQRIRGEMERESVSRPTTQR